ncbi:MAG: Flp pilus assembly complex ATPase component TadA [Lentisphaeria bacterium]|nr:Flp pilus assembly complex ATPase component TadA [Lentisphaeria bacterium]
MLDASNIALIDLLKNALAATHPDFDNQVEEIIEEHERSGKPIIEIVENYGILNEDEILQLIADSLGTEVWDFKSSDINKKIIDMVDDNTARSYCIVPVAFEDDVLKIAVKDPFDFQTIDSLSFILGQTLQVVIVKIDQLERALDRYYPEREEDIDSIIMEMGYKEFDEDSDVRDLEDAANDAPIIRFVDVVMQQAIRDRASDIHFEPFEKNFRIRYRVDGALYEMPPPPKSMAIPVISRVKIISGLNISEKRRPQDGRIQLRVGGRPIDLRVSCLPTSYGESVVLRVLDRTVVNLDLEALGLSQSILKQLRELIHLPNGILLVTGPTGSGKTTTLYSALKEINDPADKLLTAEDPVEYDIEGIMQVPINDAVGMTFGKALRAFLRQDPDRILVGEIRDFETAQIAIEASLTGHFVFSTLHTNDSASTVTRLIDMGVEPFLICSSLSGVLSQRLIRRVCPNCKVEYDPTDEDLERLQLTREEVAGHKFCYGKGCKKCNNTGYKGRKAIVELMVIDNSIRELIYANAPMAKIRDRAIENGMLAIRDDGILAILNGETSVDEVVKYTMVR